MRGGGGRTALAVGEIFGFLAGLDLEVGVGVVARVVRAVVPTGRNIFIAEKGLLD